MVDDSSPTRRGTLVRAVVFLLFFLGVLLLASYRFLIPAIEAAKSPDLTPSQRHELAAISRLVLAVVLFVLLVGLLMAFPLSRYFFPRRSTPKTKTEYVDAWEESARRLKVPADPDDQAD